MVELSTEADKLRQFYELEKSLADRIRQAPREERTKVTMEAYNELLQKITWHPMLNESTEYVRQSLSTKQNQVSPLLRGDETILEIGCGRGEFTKRLSKMAKRAVGVDISTEVLPDPNEVQPSNVEFKVGNACDLQDEEKYDLIYSGQLLEHLHPDDVPLHLECMFKLLKPGGRYAFDTPSSITGPHDVSRHFDEVATGFHLKEWTYKELRDELRKIGFVNIRVRLLPDKVYNMGKFFHWIGFRPVGYKIFLEKLVGRIRGASARRKIAVKLKLGHIFIVAQRP